MICLLAPPSVPPALEEAHHRIIAELRAAGFVVQNVSRSGVDETFGLVVPEECSGASGVLALEPRGSELTLLAAAPAEDPLQQRMDLRSERTTPEVIAIRAVEGLRAALIQAVRKGSASSLASPTAVRDFTHLGPADERTEVGEVLTPEEASLQHRRRGSSRSPSSGEKRQQLMATLGPQLTSDGGDPGVGIELLVGWRPGILSLGLLLDASLVPGVLDVEGGSVSFRQYSALGRVAGELPCPEPLLCQVGINFGVRQLSLEAKPAQASAAPESDDHTSAFVSADILGGYLLNEHWGVGVRLGVGGLLDAPAVGDPSDAETWSRPSVSGSISVLASF